MQGLRIKRTIAKAAMMLVVMLLSATGAWAWTGSGTSADPYQITSASDLAQLATDVNGGSRYANKYFLQTANITALSTMATIGTSTPFCGHYDGGGFTISGLTKPLFGSIQKGETGYQQYTLAEVKDLTISGAEISILVTGGTMGILAKAIYNNVSITNCHVVNSSLAITGGSDAKCGGLIGSVEDDQSSQPLATVSGCSVTATSITNNISGQYCGGLLGYLTCRKNVYDNFVETTLTGDNKGGIAGKLTNTTTPSDYHDNYYHAATGLTAIPSQTDNGEAAVCALSGVPSGVTVSPTALLTRDTKNYYAVGNVTLTIDDANKIFSSFNVSGATYSVAGNKKSATVTLATSDATVSTTLLVITGSCGDNATWTMSDADSDGTYETLTISGTGATYDYNASDNRAPWKTDFSPTKLVLASGITQMSIADEADLRNLSAAVKTTSNVSSDKTFRQTADIDLSSGGNFYPIGGVSASHSFQGTYDGLGHIISGLSVSKDYGNLGLFGVIKGATVRNVILISPSVRATISDNTSTDLGALIGCCGSGGTNTVENCHVVSPTLTIDYPSSEKYLGAIIGQIYNTNTTVRNCYYYDNVHDYALVGTNDDGTLTRVARARKVTLGSGVTVSPAASDPANGFVYNNESYYREGQELTLIYGVTIPEGQHLVFTLNCKAIDNNTLRMPAADVIVHAAIGTRYHYDNTTGELVLIAGEFSYDNKWGNEVAESQVTSVTATKQVSFTGNCSYLFENYVNCTSIDLSNVNTASVTNMSRMFNNCKRLTSLDLTDWNTGSVTNMSSMFNNCTGLTSLDLTGWNTASVTNMSSMFNNCTGLTSLDLTGWNTASVTHMSSMFSNCTGLTSLDLTGWNTASVTNMSSMFNNCTGLTSLDLTDWNTASVTTMMGMFYNCTDLTSLDLTGWNTASVTNMTNMFYNCTGLRSLDLSGWNTASVTDMSSMFKNCKSLTSLDLTDWNTGSVTNMSSMFYGCKNLVTIFVGTGWSTTKVTEDSDMFKSCNCLVGGNGTIYKQQHIDKEYARIDSDVRHGYFTNGDKSQITLFDNSSNQTVISRKNGKSCDAVTLQGRTLTKDGNWNTLCLPFSLSAEQIAASPLADATIKTLDNSASGTSLNNGTLTLKFTEATAITAGVPYIIKWAKADGYDDADPETRDIKDPVFTDVTISSTTPTEVTSTDGKVTFVGQYSPFSITDENKNEIILMTTGNKLGYSKNARTLKTFRCHFYVPANGGQQQARSFNVDFGEVTEIGATLNDKEKMINDKWYSLDGRQLDGKPTAKGIYVNKGHKVVIK